MLNVKKLNRQILFLSVTAALLIAGIGTSTAALASKMTPQVVAESEYTSSDNAASEVAASKVPEGKITEPAQVSGTQPAKSSTIPAQENTAGQLVAEPAESAPVTVPKASAAQSDSGLAPAPAPAQKGAITEAIPELVPVPAPAPAENVPVI